MNKNTELLRVYTYVMEISNNASTRVVKFLALGSFPSPQHSVALNTHKGCLCVCVCIYAYMHICCPSLTALYK